MAAQPTGPDKYKSKRLTNELRCDERQDLILQSPHLVNRHITIATPSQPTHAENCLAKATLSKFLTLPEVICVYGLDNKCSGTIIPQRLSILQDAFNSAHHRGVHALLNPPVQDLATEIHRLYIPQLSITGNNSHKVYKESPSVKAC
jgi:hypothetical protein